MTDLVGNTLEKQYLTRLTRRGTICLRKRTYRDLAKSLNAKSMADLPQMVKEYVKESMMPTAVQVFLKKSGSTDGQIVDVVTIMEAAEILGIGMESVRRLEWNLAFGKPSDHRRPGRKGVLIPKRAILEYKKNNPGGSSKNRVGGGITSDDVVGACKLVASVMLGDESITDKVYRNNVNTMLTKYVKQAEGVE